MDTKMIGSFFEGTEKRKQYDTGAVGRTDWRYQ